MPKKRSRVFSRAFKLAAVRRMMAGEDVSALARELRVLRKDLYKWRAGFRSGGPAALRQRGRPRKVAVGKSGGATAVSPPEHPKAAERRRE